MIDDRTEKEAILALIAEKERRKDFKPFTKYFPDKGPLRRELYQKHLRFFAAGLVKRERLFMAANRTGKTEGAGGVEAAYHLTGRYPPWWEGRRFDRPVDMWAAGNTGKTTRDIIQAKLFGEKGKFGSGLIPLHLIHGSPTTKSGVPDAYDTVMIKHVSGGHSILQLKSFDQGRTAFEGTEKDIIWLDEEPPLDVYTECVLRTTDTTGTGLANGMIMLTFTPLLGMSETVMTFLPNGEVKEFEEGSKHVTMASWDDVPHLTEQTKKELWASIPPFQRDARSKGIPQLGAGAIYPVPEADIAVDDFPIPEHWPRFYSQDVGWNRTAVGWYAFDLENDIMYRYSEHYRGEAEPIVHAQAIKSRGDWIEGVIDPAARGRSQADGTQLVAIYKKLGLKLHFADNAVEAGIYAVWERMSQGKFKVFKSCSNWFSEFRLYRRDEKGRIVKINDHAMDEMRYAVMAGRKYAKTKPIKKPTAPDQHGSGGPTGWMS